MCVYAIGFFRERDILPRNGLNCCHLILADLRGHFKESRKPLKGIYLENNSDAQNPV